MKRWSLCKYCRLDTRCENQDRGHPCWFERQPQYKLFKDCQLLAKKVLELSPDHRGWLEANFSEYVDQQKDWVNGI